jgi:hypothetical protein
MSGWGEEPHTRTSREVRGQRERAGSIVQPLSLSRSSTNMQVSTESEPRLASPPPLPSSPPYPYSGTRFSYLPRRTLRWSPLARSAASSSSSLLVPNSLRRVTSTG